MTGVIISCNPAGHGTSGEPRWPRRSVICFQEKRKRRGREKEGEDWPLPAERPRPVCVCVTCVWLAVGGSSPPLLQRNPNACANASVPLSPDRPTRHPKAAFTREIDFRAGTVIRPYRPRRGDALQRLMNGTNAGRSSNQLLGKTARGTATVSSFFFLFFFYFSLLLSFGLRRSRTSRRWHRGNSSLEWRTNVFSVRRTRCTSRGKARGAECLVWSWTRVRFYLWTQHDSASFIIRCARSGYRCDVNNREVILIALIKPVSD